MVMDDDEITFYIFTRRHSEGSRMTHFNFYFCLFFAYLLLNRRVPEIFALKLCNFRKKNKESKNEKMNEKIK